MLSNVVAADRGPTYNDEVLGIFLRVRWTVLWAGGLLLLATIARRLYADQEIFAGLSPAGLALLLSASATAVLSRVASGERRGLLAGLVSSSLVADALAIYAISHSSLEFDQYLYFSIYPIIAFHSFYFPAFDRRAIAASTGIGGAIGPGGIASLVISMALLYPSEVPRERSSST